ncbi:hypothetical protein IL54_1075 [Sphingobium sp. ba1]|uniref:DUF1593 domain-containing protein n=2 Tax=unclassified Sphingobium TaxID=2611147 RepID=UPI00050778CD|nr:hypothetical protein IL54_1075 [Sphingobium sp. ba1]
MKSYWKILRTALLMLSVSLCTFAETLNASTPRSRSADVKPRVIITADPELDDSNSLLRYLLYSSDFRTEGLIYASSQFHWKGDGKGTLAVPDGMDYRRLKVKPCPCTSWRWNPDERFIDDAVALYSKVYPNLRRHKRGYPTPASLKDRIRWGNVAFDGEMSEDTPGSDLIKTVLLDDDDAPVYLHAWGGQSTIARALKSIEDTYKGTIRWNAIREKIIRKAVIHPSGDQDDTYAKYIKPHWPEIRYQLTLDAVNLSYFAHDAVSADDALYFSAPWTQKNISARGRAGSFYYVWGDGRQMVAGDKFDYFGFAGKSADELQREGYNIWTPIRPKGSFIGEGDTPTFLNLIDNGLKGYLDDSFGGWGGYLDPAPRLVSMREFNGPFSTPVRAPTHPFLAAAQRDFAGRLAWSQATSYGAANHHPIIILGMPTTLSAKPGTTLSLKGRTRDPDGDKVSLTWWLLEEKGGTFHKQVLNQRVNGQAVFVVANTAKAGDRIQIVAEATDAGKPALTRYEKIIVTVH